VMPKIAGRFSGHASERVFLVQVFANPLASGARRERSERLGLRTGSEATRERSEQLGVK